MDEAEATLLRPIGGPVSSRAPRRQPPDAEDAVALSSRSDMPHDEPADVGSYVRALRGSWKEIVLFTVALMGIAVSLTASTPPAFVATAQLGPAASLAAADARQGVGALAATILSPETLQRVAEDLPGTSRSELQRSTTVAVDPDSVTLSVSVSDADPVRAAALANAVAATGTAADRERRAAGYADLRRRLQSELQVETEPAARARISERIGELAAQHAVTAEGIGVLAGAVPPASARSPKMIQAAAMAGLAGLVIAGAGIAVLEQVRPRAREPHEIARAVNLPLLRSRPARTPLLRGGGWSRGRTDLRGPADDLRMLLELHASRRGSGPVLICGLRPGEGGGQLALALAQGLAEAGQRLLLVAADPWSQSVDGRPGFLDVMRGTARLEEAAAPEATGARWTGSLELLPTGTGPSGAAPLTRTTLRSFVSQARQLGFDRVVLDGPSLLDRPVATKLLASACDQVVMVTSDRPLAHETAARARGDVQDLPVPPLGLLVLPARSTRPPRGMRSDAPAEDGHAFVQPA